jgi:TrmH family RNA methyltransferase
LLTSVKNPKVAAVARLKKRAFRDEDRAFLVEGAQGVAEALDAAALTTLFVVDDLEPLAVKARQAGVTVELVSEEVMGKLTSTVTPQGLVGVSPFLDAELDTIPDDGCVTVLHEVRDPGNAGTVLRSADAAGAGGVIFTDTSVDPYNPKTVRASAGSLFHVPFVRGADTQTTLAELQRRGFRILAMAADGEDDLYRTDLASGSIALVFGNEARGLPDAIRTMADKTVHVPILGKAESLNLAAAATVCLFEWARQRARAGEALETIISAAAHDIRSPLTAMKGFGYALEKRWEQMTLEQRSLMLQGIVHDADRMDTILRQLVDAARVVSGTLEPFPEKVEIADLVVAISDAQRRDPDHPAVEWAGEAVTVFVDPMRLKTAILAFLEALVWWGSEGPIRIEAQHSNGKLLVAASRSCVSLAPDQIEDLFLARRPGSGAGSKIGLFVTRGVMQAQRGRAWGTIEAERLTFHLEIPTEG